VSTRLVPLRLALATSSALAFCLLTVSPAAAVSPDECEQQRALFPKDWNDVSKEKPLFRCWSHYSGAFRVTLGPTDDKGRRLLSLVPLDSNRDDAKQDTSKMFFAFGWTKSRRSDWNKESISLPSRGSGSHAGFAETFQGTRSSSWTTQIPSLTAPTRARSTTRRRVSVCFKAIPISAMRSSSATVRV
jgi:hypothetical protein